MSDARGSTAAQPPRWMPVGDDADLCAAGQWWDAIRVPEAAGFRVIDLLKESSRPVGPIIHDQYGLEPRLYFLIPAGHSAGWDEPDTVALGRGCHVVVPPYSRTAPPGLHWLYLPSRPRVFSDPDHLRRALRKALREGQGVAVPAPVAGQRYSRAGSCANSTATTHPRDK